MGSAIERLAALAGPSNEARDGHGRWSMGGDAAALEAHLQSAGHRVSGHPKTIAAMEQVHQRLHERDPQPDHVHTPEGWKHFRHPAKTAPVPGIVGALNNLVRGRYVAASAPQTAIDRLEAKLAGPADEARDDHGRWTAGGGGASAAPVGGSTSIAVPTSVEEMKALQAQWANLDRQLLPYAGDPFNPAARAILNQQKDVIKAIHHANLDMGGAKGIGLPGGPRDMVVVGGGPAGLSASIYGATEGLDTLLVDANDRPGGQSAYSSRIENVMGFPTGVTGAQLAQASLDQAERVGAECRFGVRCEALDYDPETGLKTLHMSDGTTIQARSVVVAGGVQFRTMDFPGSDAQGVVYGDSAAMKDLGEGRPAVVVGGANSAGQAAVDLASTLPKVSVLVRGDGLHDMSSYLTDQLSSAPNVEVLTHAETSSVTKDESGRVARVNLKDGRSLEAGTVGLFIGSAPNANWTGAETNSHGYLTTHNFETSVPGVFAAGDIRAENLTHRVAVAAGEGAQVVSYIHTYIPGVGVKNEVIKAAGRSMSRPVSAIPKDDADTFMEWMDRYDSLHPYTGVSSVGIPDVVMVDGMPLNLNLSRRGSLDRLVRLAGPEGEARDDHGRWTSVNAGALKAGDTIRTPAGAKVQVVEAKANADGKIFVKTENGSSTLPPGLKVDRLGKASPEDNGPAQKPNQVGEYVGAGGSFAGSYSGTIVLQNQLANHDKFYESTALTDENGNAFHVKHWGRNGTAGQWKVDAHPTFESAQAAHQKILDQKVGKGYEHTLEDKSGSPWGTPQSPYVKQDHYNHVKQVAASQTAEDRLQVMLAGDGGEATCKCGAPISKDENGDWKHTGESAQDGSHKPEPKSHAEMTAIADRMLVQLATSSTALASLAVKLAGPADEVRDNHGRWTNSGAGAGHTEESLKAHMAKDHPFIVQGKSTLNYLHAMDHRASFAGHAHDLNGKVAARASLITGRKDETGRVHGEEWQIRDGKGKTVAHTESDSDAQWITAETALPGHDTKTPGRR